MVNEATISPLPLLYFYLSLPILIIIVTTTTIYPSLTLIPLYLFNLPTPFFSPFLRKSLYFLTFPPNLFTLRSTLSLCLCSFVIFLLFYSFFSFEGFSVSSVRSYRQGLVVLRERPSGEIR